MRKISNIFKKSDNNFRLFYLNTNTILDINSGKFRKGISEFSIFKKIGQHYLDGGISPSFAVVGRSQTYKSSMCLSWISRVLKLYKDSEAFIYDTEFAISDKERIINLSSELDTYYPQNLNDLEDRIILKDKSDLDMEEFFNTIKEIANEREKHKKDYLIETPFINIKDNKPYKTMIPYIVLIDSYSLLQSKKEYELLEKHDLSDSELNTLSMNDGKYKSILMRYMISLTKKAGIYFVLTAHLGKKIQLNPFERNVKDLQFFKGSDTLKHVGSQFGFLINTLLVNNNVTCLLDSNKNILYPPKYKVPNTELNLIFTDVCRCKNNVSGATFTPIMSQYNGILEGLSCYHILKTSPLNPKSKFYGFKGSPQKHHLFLLEKYKLSRTKIRELISDHYELYRALEIITQIYYIIHYWTLCTNTLDILNKLDIEKISDKLIKYKKLSISDILNSRSYWTYDKQDPRKFLSIIDIIEILND